MTIALITGSNRGIGYATARALAATGVSVILTGRNFNKVDRAAKAIRDSGHQASSLELDVTETSSVANAAAQVQQQHGSLDILVNNAGIVAEDLTGTDTEFADVELFEMTYQVNVFGVVAVTEAFLPLLRQSSQARIVNVSSTMGSLNDQSDPDSNYYGMIVPAYQSSKAALNCMTIGMAKKLSETNIKVSSVCPGFVQTDLTPINRDNAPLTAEQASTVIVAAATLSEEADNGSFFDRDGPVAW